MQAVVVKRQMRGKPEYRGIVMVDVNLSYPQVVTRGAPAGAGISEYYSKAASAYYSYATGELYKSAVNDYIERRKNKFPFHTYTAMMVYEVPYNQNPFISIFLDVYEFTGGAHGNTARQADTWSLDTGRPMRLSDFFTGPAYLSIIYGNIMEQIDAQIANGMNIYFDDYRRNVFKYFDERNFYLTPQGVAIYYPLYTIAPYSSGIVTFVIPYEAFDNLKYDLAGK